jgi:ribose 5-phosphate isomerase RpiB
MANIDQQLVKAIADEVMRALERDPGSLPTAIHPPAGVCTGDYSKFTELSARSIGATKPNPAPAATPRVAALTGIITADQLRDAMKAAPDGVALVAKNARLTPLAQDLAREQPDKLRRVDPASIAEGRPSTSPPPWLWWADGHCPHVQTLTADHRGRLSATVASRDSRGLLHVVRELARRVRLGEVSGGVLFVESGALAMCYANRCRSLRAVLGTCVEATKQGVRDVGLNVLVVEYRHVKAHTMREMVEMVLASRPAAPPQVQRELDELRECE